MIEREEIFLIHNKEIRLVNVGWYYEEVLDVANYYKNMVQGMTVNLKTINVNGVDIPSLVVVKDVFGYHNTIIISPFVFFLHKTAIKLKQGFSKKRKSLFLHRDGVLRKLEGFDSSYNFMEFINFSLVSGLNDDKYSGFIEIPVLGGEMPRSFYLAYSKNYRIFEKHHKNVVYFLNQGYLISEEV